MTMRTVSGLHHFITLPDVRTIKRMTVANGFLYVYCDDAAGGEKTLKIRIDEDGKGHIEQMLRLGA